MSDVDRAEVRAKIARIIDEGQRTQGYSERDLRSVIRSSGELLKTLLEVLIAIEARADRAEETIQGIERVAGAVNDVRVCSIIAAYRKVVDQ